MSAEEADVNFQPPVKSVSIENMVRMRQAVADRVEQAIALLHEAKEIAEAAHLGFPNMMLSDSYRGRGETPALSPEGKATILRVIDKHAWSYLMSESGNLTFMDAEARKKWGEEVHEGNVPPLTEENVRATFQSLHAARGEMFERGVIRCFKKLSWCYRTNNPFRFGKRIIVEYLFSPWGKGKAYLSLNHTKCNELDDLVRVFSVLDGKPEPDHRNGVYHTLSTREKHGMEADLEYFSLKWFLKGTGHLTFKRPDLVHQLNDIIAKHYPGALPGPRA